MGQKKDVGNLGRATISPGRLRKQALERVDAVNVPDEYQPAATGNPEWKRNWVNRGDGHYFMLGVSALGGYSSGLVLVECGGCSVKCHANHVQKAVDHALKWVELGGGSL